MNRRHFIFISASGIASVSIPTACHLIGDVKYDPLLARPQSLSLIWDNETIKSVGDRYRSIIPSEKGERDLAKRLNKDLENAAIVDVSAIEEIIKKDFAGGNTVIINGWILSQTEARQCALFSITESK